MQDRMMLGWRTGLLGAALVITTACSAPGGEDVGAARLAAANFPNDKTAYDYFRAKGLTNFQAAGVVGNLDQESGIDPEIHQNNGGVGRGIAQWSAGARWDKTTNDNVLAFATQKGQSPTSLALQLDFIWYELTTFPDYGLAALKATTTLDAATQVFEDEFEGCVYANYPECALPSRVQFAKAVFDAYGNDPVPGGGGAGGTSGAGAGGAASAGTGGTGGTGTGGAGTDPGAGAPSAGSGGSSSLAGAPASAGSSAAGSANLAGAPSSSTGGTGAFQPPSTGTDSSGCAVGVSRRAPTDGAFTLGGLFAALAFVRARRRVAKRRPHSTGL